MCVCEGGEGGDECIQNGLRGGVRFGQTDLSKQCRAKSDATERGVRMGSTLFATHPALYTYSQVGKWTC